MTTYCDEVDILEGICNYQGYNGPATPVVQTGTTIMAVEFDGGVVLGADSRTSTGDYIANRCSRKITKITDNIFMCRSGSAADTQAIASYAEKYVNTHAIELDRPATVSAAANIIRLITYGNKDNLLAGMIVAGYDEYEGGQVYTIPLGGTKIRQKVSIGGSGSTYILGLADATYRPNMTARECEEFVKKNIAHAMARDGSSGGLIRTVIITKEGVEENVCYGEDLPFAPY